MIPKRRWRDAFQIIALGGSTFVTLSALTFILTNAISAIGLFADMLQIMSAVLTPLLAVIEYRFLKMRTPNINESILEPLHLRLKREQSQLRIPEMFHRPYPEWIEYEKGYLHERKEIEELQQNFEHSNIQLLFGESGAGKTTLATLLGFRWMTTKKANHVFYCDLNENSADDCDTEIQKLLTDADSNGSTLVIVDNIHLSHRMGRNQYRKRKQAEKSKVYILLVARSTGIDYSRMLVNLISRIVEQDEHLFLDVGEDNFDVEGFQSVNLDVISQHIKTVLLKKQSFHDVMRSIANLFMKREGFTISDRDLFFRALASKCQSTLWLLSYIFQGLQKLSPQNSTLSSETLQLINVCTEIKYYYNRIQQEFLDFMDSKRLFFGDDTPTKKTLFVSMYGMIAVLNSFEISVPEGFVVDVLSSEGVSQKQTTVYTQALRSFSVERGEIVTQNILDYKVLSFPHLTLAHQFLECYESELPHDIIESWADVETFPEWIFYKLQIPPIANHLLDYYEKSGLLQKHLTDDNLPVNAELWIPLGLQNKPELLGTKSVQWALNRIVESSDDGLDVLFGLRGQLHQVDTNLFCSMAAKALAYHLSPSDYEVEWLLEIPGLSESSEFLSSAASVIRNEWNEKPWILKNLLGPPSSLLGSDIIMAVVRELIKDPQGSLYLEDSLEGIRSLLEKENVRKSICELITAVPSLLEKFTADESVLYYKDIKDALVRAIRKGPHPWIILDILSHQMKQGNHLDMFLGSRLVTDAIKSRTEDIVAVIHKSDHPEWIIRCVADIPILVEDPRVIGAIAERMDSAVVRSSLRDVIRRVPALSLSRRIKKKLEEGNE